MTEVKRVNVDVSDLVPGQIRAIDVGGRKILLCNAQGQYFAVQERCSHAAYSLAEGRLTGFLLECPLHGARFDVRDGSPARRPAIKPLETYALSVVDGNAEVVVAPTQPCTCPE